MRGDWSVATNAMKDPVESPIRETGGGGSGRDTSILLGEVTLS